MRCIALKTVKSLLLSMTLLWPFLTPAFIQADGLKVNITTDDSDSATPQALVLSVHGKCDYSEDGATFTALKAGHVFKEGAIVRTAEDARTDLFFRRIGTTVRLQSGTEVK